MAKYPATIAQWGLVSGIRQDTSDLVIVHPTPGPFGPQARKGQLIIVAEAAGDVSRGREACTLVAQTLHATFYESSSGSLTSALRQAMHAANTALYQYNFQSPPHKRTMIGVSAAVLHGSDLYLAQVSPCQAFVSHAGKLRALPNPVGWIGGAQSGPALGSTGMLGTSLGSEPEFFRSVLQPGDSVALCSSNIARLLSRSQGEELLCFADAGAIAEGLYTLCRRASLPEAHAVVIEVLSALSAEAQHAPLSAVGVSERGKLAVGKVGAWLGDVATEAQLAVQGRPRPKEGANGPAEAAPPAPTAVGQALLDTVPVGDAEPLPLSAFLGEGDYGGVVRPPAPKRDRRIDLGDNTGTPLDFTALPKRGSPPTPSLGERATLPFRRVLVGMLGNVASGPRRSRRALEDGPRQSPKVRGLSYRRTRPPFPWVNLGVLCILFGLLVVVGLRANRSRDASTAQVAITAVQSALQAARAATTSDAAQAQLTLAADNLEKIEPLIASGLITTSKTVTWRSYQALLQDYDAAMAQINQIGFFDDFATLFTLPSAAQRIQRLVLAPDSAQVVPTFTENVYVLDNQGTVFVRTPADTAPRALLADGYTAAGVTVGKISELLWRNDQPLALERNPDPSNPFMIAYLSGSDGWFSTNLPGSEWLPEGDTAPMTSFGGNLYVWNATAQKYYGVATQLLKYGTGRYADVPDEWITARDPKASDNVVSVAIDGNVYLLHSDASISVYDGGSFAKRFAAPDLLTPVVAVSRFCITPDETNPDNPLEITRPGHIYILDTQNERVLQLSKSDGRLIQQMQARTQGPLNQLTDVQVDEGRSVVYLANGGSVLRAKLPTPPTPSGGETATPSTTP